MKEQIRDGTTGSQGISARPPAAARYGKGKQQDAEFEREFTWVVKKVQKEVDASNSPKDNDEVFDDGEVEDGSGTSCGCCFSDFRSVGSSLSSKCITDELPGHDGCLP